MVSLRADSICDPNDPDHELCVLACGASWPVPQLADELDPERAVTRIHRRATSP